MPIIVYKNGHIQSAFHINSPVWVPRRTSPEKHKRQPDLYYYNWL